MIRDLNSEELLICFRCGDLCEDDQSIGWDPDLTLGLCPCKDGWYVGTPKQLSDYLNSAHLQLEELGLLDEPLQEYNPDDEDIDFDSHGETVYD